MTFQDLGKLLSGQGPVVQHPETGRWFITMGQPGFNAPANNGAGYSTFGLALATRDHYAASARRAA